MGPLSGLDELAPDRKAYDVSHRAEMQFSHDVRAVRVDSLHADAERRSRLLAALPFSDESNDLALARGDVSRRWARRHVVLGGVSAPDVVVEHEFGDGRREKRLVLSKALDTRDQ